MRTWVPSVNATVRHSPSSVSMVRSNQATLTMKPNKSDTVRQATDAAIFQDSHRARDSVGGSAGGSIPGNSSMTLDGSSPDGPGGRFSSFEARNTL
jgi:hypothetical protein